jgi:murein DD-endopeptidase MepM/ murein hydrolase activator NlpD
MAWPVSPPAAGFVTSPFGRRRLASVPGTFHYGLDIGAVEGTVVVAPVGGRVTRIGWSTTGGWQLTLRVRHCGEDLDLRFAHMRESPALLHLRVGSKVRGGQQVAWVGSTGLYALGAHLHFEIRDLEGKARDPRPLLSEPLRPTARVVVASTTRRALAPEDRALRRIAEILGWRGRP